MQEFMALANILADEAGEIVRKYYRTPFDIEHKDDASPVTIADRAVEKRLREIIEQTRPDDGILGEEYGIKESKNGLTWVLDPIDGTKPFTIGRPTFGTLIALCENDIPVLGIIDQAILNDRWVGVKGHPTTHNGKIVKTRACAKFTNAVCSSSSPGMFDQNYPGFIQDWRDRCKYIVWGGDCLSYGLMASGFLDVVIESNMQAYDYLAHVPIINGAGGMICDWEGDNLTLKSGQHVIAMSDKRLWEQTRALFKDA